MLTTAVEALRIMQIGTRARYATGCSGTEDAAVVSARCSIARFARVYGGVETDDWVGSKGADGCSGGGCAAAYGSSECAAACVAQEASARGGFVCDGVKEGAARADQIGSVRGASIFGGNIAAAILDGGANARVSCVLRWQ